MTANKKKTKKQKKQYLSIWFFFSFIDASLLQITMTGERDPFSDEINF